MNIDAGQATIITDRCIPPAGLGTSPSTIKAVLWCLRGLGAPGADLLVYSSMIETRTCLSRRAVSRAVSALRDAGILDTIEAPSPGRPTRYRLHYDRLAQWLQDGDRPAARLDDGRTTGTRSKDGESLDRETQSHTIKSTGAPQSTSCAPQSISCAPESTDIKEETAFLHSGSSSRDDLDALLAAAAADCPQTVEDWSKIAKSAGIERDEAEQLARTLVSHGVEDSEKARNAIERIAERMKSGKISNPTGLLIRFLGDPELELSRAAIARKRRREAERKKLRHSIERWDPTWSKIVRSEISKSIAEDLGSDAAMKLLPGGEFAKDIQSWDAMVDYILARWTKRIRPAAHQLGGNQVSGKVVA